VQNACCEECCLFQAEPAAARARRYDLRYVRRTGDRPDGCLTFWDAARFSAVSAEALRMRDLGLRDNVALLVLLQPIAGGGGGSGGAGPCAVGPEAAACGDAAASCGAAGEAACGGGRAPADAQVANGAPAGGFAQQAPHPNKAGAGAGVPVASGAGAAAAPLLLVGNTHLLFNPRRGDIKVRSAWCRGPAHCSGPFRGTASARPGGLMLGLALAKVRVCCRGSAQKGTGRPVYDRGCAPCPSCAL